MSQQEQPKGGEMIPAGGRDLARRSRDLVVRGLADLQSSPLADSQGQSTELDSSGTWHYRATFRAHADSHYGLAISRDGAFLAIGGWDGTVRLWGLRDGTLLGSLEAHSDEVIVNYVTCLAISPDSRLLLSGTRDGNIRLWSLPNGELVKVLKERYEYAECMAVSPDGKLLVTGNLGTLCVWDLAEGQPICTLEGHQAHVRSVTISRDGQFLASADFYGSVRLWELPQGKLLSVPLPDKGYYVEESPQSMVLSPDGRLLATGGHDNHVYICTVPEGETRRLEGHRDRIRSLAMSPDGALLASGSNDSSVRLWSLPNGNTLQTLKGHESSHVTCLVISPDGRLLASEFASEGPENYVQLWGLPEGKAICTLKHPGWLTSLAMTPDSRTLIGVGNDGSVRLWGK
jgi:WD40 repeat protein